VHPNDEGNTEIDVLHPEGCPRRELYDGLMTEYDCAISRHIVEWGYDLYLEDVANGLYLATFWATPPVSGPVPVDADAGIELTRLVISEERDAEKGKVEDDD
jgi:hypothetical protein